MGKTFKDNKNDREQTIRKSCSKKQRDNRDVNRRLRKNNLEDYEN